MMQTEDQTIESAEAALTDDQIAALIADAPAENPAAFVPTDAGGVDWVLAKIAAYRVEAALIRENMGIMARTCDRKAEALLWKYNAPLQTYLRGELEGGKGKEKSKRLPHGLIGFRTPPVSVQVTSPAAVMAWARENLAEGIVIDTVDRTALKKRMMQTGEVVDGAQIVPAEEIFYIK